MSNRPPTSKRPRKGRGRPSRRGTGRRRSSELASSERRERPDGLLTTGDMATQTGSTLRTVRFYEEAGILRPDRRSAGGHRLYGPRQLERLQFITDLRAAGLSLDDIRELLETRAGATTGRQAATEIVEAIEPRLAALEQKIEVFTRLKSELHQTRQILAECQQCGHRKGFPRTCESCEVLGRVDELPPSFRVLWMLGAE